MDQYNKVSDLLFNFFPNPLVNLINQYKLEPDEQYEKKLNKCLDKMLKEYKGLANIYDEIPRIGHLFESKVDNYILYQCQLNLKNKLMIIRLIRVDNQWFTTNDYVEAGRCLKFEVFPVDDIRAGIRDNTVQTYYPQLRLYGIAYNKRFTFIRGLGKNNERFSRDSIKFP